MASVSPDQVAALQAEMALLDEYTLSSELGVLFSSALYGVFCTQVYIYWTSKRDDSRGLKLLVSFVFLIETVHTVLLSVYLCQNNRKARYNPAALLELAQPLAYVYFTSGLMGATVQSYYAYRLYRLSGKLWLAILPWAGSAARLGLAAGGVAVTPRAPQIVEFMTRYGWCMRGVFGASVGVDVMNTTALCFILARSRGEKAETTRVVDRLILWTIETGLITSVLAILMLIFTLIGRYSLIPGFVHVYPNLFSLSLLISLNAREGLRQTLYSARMTIFSRSQVGTASFSFSNKNTTHVNSVALAPRRAQPVTDEAAASQAWSHSRLDTKTNDWETEGTVV
ncbi:hypothetical protein EXIGLDRAFT_760908 [Exidia glandulosa HHB12029]|uniref:DUF6534 domain-containing protein n=1 Tax=Exidia glandulosa HHB12029 TaxID=1314781 RepID=A0A165NYY1_EXIGL|nr:hypothetical protein EXIGLDRAFT_760908 [Exidia glandulosa HHB12029]